MIPSLTPLAWIEWQIEHYSELIANARSFEQKVFLRKELYNLKIQQQCYLN